MTKQIQSWSTSQTGVLTSITTRWPFGTSIFVAYNGDIYVDASNGSSSLIERRSSSTTATAWNTVMITDESCSSIFVSIYNDIYCSIEMSHKVQRRRSIDPIEARTDVAGTGTNGSAINQLNQPRGIYVTRDLDLYVADSGNHRIQYFRFDQTVNTSFHTSNGITLQCPTGVVLDVNGSLFITDFGYHRIIRYVLGNFQCIAGCSGNSAPMPYQLNHPSSLALDSRGNLYVLDRSNQRVQKFSLENTSCGELNVISLKIHLYLTITRFSAPIIKPSCCSTENNVCHHTTRMQNSSHHWSWMQRQ
jgi:DNA-binding beta-propeller fold protein YncE